MNNQSSNSVIPEGELRCVWMDAGIAEYKLCDQEFRCETCAFHMNVTQQKRPVDTPPAQDVPPVSAESFMITADTLFNNVLKKRLDQLRAVSIPQDRVYSRGQFWIQQNDAGNYRVGINHILANFFQPMLSIVLSKAPAVIHRLDPFFWIVLPGGAVTLRSPIEATVTRFNPALHHHPQLLCASPFDEGWIMEITAKSKGLNRVTSPSDTQRALKRTMHTIEHILKQTYQHLQPAAGTTLFDGGAGISSVENILGPALYKEVVNRVAHFPS
ncbi:MAG: hypothetical protein EHM64_08485 [Ignavibacteriae bacterium]|nr:MAG: hypothetical protein EHM64_08485 [Ignavibacteriota bacterium]